jgi:hypothetical protein
VKILIVLFSFSAIVRAETLKLDNYDQLKLAELLARIPAEAKEEKAEKDESRPGLQKKIMAFPKEDIGLRILCEAQYYNNSPYISKAQCALEIDPNHRSIEHSYDEYRIKIADETSASGIFTSIPHGLPRRELRSWKRDVGTNFQGKKSEIFRYYFSCSKSECEVLISEKGLF